MNHKNNFGQERPIQSKSKRRNAGMILAITVILVLLIMTAIISLMVITAKSKEKDRDSKKDKTEKNIEESMSMEESKASDEEGAYGSESSSEYSGESHSYSSSAPEGSSSVQESSEAPAQPQYILPESNTRYLTMDDLEGLTKEECRIARNELFARHGRIFTDEELQAYFDSLDWYQGTIQPDDFDEAVFNAYEIANRDLIIKYEKEQGYR